MTSTSFSVGLPSSSRKSSRVLKSPGGGTSDIFGTGDVQSVEQCPKRRTNHMQSSLFVFVDQGPVGTTPTCSKPGDDTFNRLFGEGPLKPATPFSQTSKSNLGFSDHINNTASANNKGITPFKVQLQSPDGGTNDIFGTGDVQSVEQCPKRRTNHMQSSLFVDQGPVGTTSTRSKPGDDTFNRLFGEGPLKPATPFSPTSKSNLGFSDHINNTASANKGITPFIEGSKQNGSKEATITNGNVNANLTVADNIADNISATSSADHNTSAWGNAPARCTRVPPGGFSSGLW